ncbi:MAG: hypothetical protein Ta2B_04690 [Termitinemataceae bacterium]|nr:MAG: hypothetical protein Ta2B_04690 [Termitinemataceae bacterium]
MIKGYEKTYDWVVKLLQDCNFTDSTRRLGLRQISPNEVTVEFLGRLYFIDKNGIHLKEEKIVWANKSEGFDFNVKSVLGYYVLSDCETEPVNEFCTLGNFSHGIFEKPILDDPLGIFFDKNYQRFCDVAKKTGMIFDESQSAGRFIWQYKLLPKIPVKLIYYEGDDEYPANIQILYDKTAIQFFKFEPLAVLNGCFKEALIAIGKNT